MLARIRVSAPLRLSRAFCSVHGSAGGCHPALTVDYARVHEHMDKHQGVAGVHGGDHAVFHALAEAKSGVTLDRLKHGYYAPSSEWKVPELVAHLQRPEVRAQWSKITTLDPLGMEAARPTISATPAAMEIPELVPKLRRDGKIVREDGLINVFKVAIDPVWYIPGVAKRLNLDEKVLREKLASWTQNNTVLDPTNDIFLPSIGGTTVYVIGDISAIVDPNRKVALRTHDECNGSDVFGTDICTCRPYLVYAIEGCVETAQAGGVGIIAYYRKEGRALGEVTKFRVYNARKYQEGGDRADTYFEQTKNIAGIVDARAQELMPDPLLWLGISRIDRLLSMSKDKYDAITGAGIQVVSRDSLPEDMVPKGAYVEISAKISSGYAAFAPKASDGATELWKLETVRARARKLYELGLKGQLPHFDIDLSKMDDLVNRVLKATSRRYPGPLSNIPLHSRMRQFDAGGVNRITLLEQQWRAQKIPNLEQARRLIDLVVTSVLVDAGAGAKWAYQDKEFAGGKYFTRSEGLGVASLDMFRNGNLSSDGKSQIVDAARLKSITAADIARAFQVTPENPLVGVEGRAQMLNRLGAAIESHPEIFAGPSDGSVPRPGYLLDYLLHETTDSHRRLASVRVLWKAVVDGFGSVFPDPTGRDLGDTWPHSSLGPAGTMEGYMPFHKLGQWLSYSLLEVLQNFGIKFVDVWLLTGLAEYRNGGLLIDTGMLVPKNPDLLLQTFKVGDEPVVEWRALTLALLDEVEKAIHTRLGVSQRDLSLAQILEGGTWAAGREIAFEKRPQTGDPPVKIMSTGDVF